MREWAPNRLEAKHDSVETEDQGRVNVAMDAELKRRLESASYALYMSQAQVVRLALRTYLDRVESGEIRV